MTNEELVIRIQSGEKHLMADLWEQVSGLVAWKANRVMAALGNMAALCGVESDDLYQSGYLALVQAVKTYDSDAGGSFSTWLMYYLQSAFDDATGNRTERQKNDPLRRYISLDTPLDDEDGGTVADLQPDPNSAEPFETVEHAIYIAELRQALEMELDKLPPQQRTTLRQRYFNTSTYEQIGKALGISGQRVCQLEDIALRALREPPHSRQLETYLESRTPYFLHVGPSEFQRSHESAVEKIVFLREKLRRLSAQKHE